MDGIEVSRHARKRTKERMGLNKKAVECNAQKAFEYGITHKEAKGRLKKYLTKLFLTNRKINNLRVYHRYVYLFAGNTLVTVIPLPSNLVSLADKLQDMKEEE